MAFRRDLQSYFHGLSSNVGESHSFSIMSLLFNYIYTEDNDFAADMSLEGNDISFFYYLDTMLWSRVFGRTANLSYLGIYIGIDIFGDMDDEHPGITVTRQKDIVRTLYGMYSTKWKSIWQTYKTQILDELSWSTNLTETTSESTSGTSGNTRTLDTKDSRSVIASGTLQRTGTDDTAYTGSETTKNTRTGSVKETPVGQVIEDSEGIMSRDYGYAFDTPSGENDPGSPLSKQGRNMTTTTKYDSRSDTTTYDNLVDQTDRSFVNRQDTTTHNTTDTNNSSTSDVRDNSGTIKDDGTTSGKSDGTRTIKGYKDVNLPALIAAYRKNWFTNFWEIVMDDITSTLCLPTYEFHI